jgi:hypothetical protein
MKRLRGQISPLRVPAFQIRHACRSRKTVCSMMRLLSYNVSKAPELSNPMDLNSSHFREFHSIAIGAFIHAVYRVICHSEQVATLTGFESICCNALHCTYLRVKCYNTDRSCIFQVFSKMQFRAAKRRFSVQNCPKILCARAGARARKHRSVIPSCRCKRDHLKTIQREIRARYIFSLQNLQNRNAERVASTPSNRPQQIASRTTFQGRLAINGPKSGEGNDCAL